MKRNRGQIRAKAGKKAVHSAPKRAAKAAVRNTSKNAKTVKPQARPAKAEGAEESTRSIKAKITAGGPSPSQLIDRRIASLPDWQAQVLSQVRATIHRAEPEITEEWKWMGTPVWYHNGPVCTGESYKQVVKITFAKGASLKDPAHLFNASLQGNFRRAIDFREGDEVREVALKELVRAAVALNVARQKKK